MNISLPRADIDLMGRTESRIPDRLFVFELANNHMGDVAHGVRVVDEICAVAMDFDFNFAFKLQYRELDTFIHPDFQGRMDIKYIKRFSETRLSRDHTLHLVEAIKRHGLTVMCTPFDEASVDRVVEDGFDILKIASCSFTDWPLLEKIATTKLPIIGSLAGIELEKIDQVVAFMQHRTKDFALMHCIAEYPTPAKNLHLNQVDFLRQRYPNLRIGYSTHESPDETVAIAVAVGKGCSIFEKHVGVATERYPLNQYSAIPDQVRRWLDAATKAFDVAGTSGQRIEPTSQELDSLVSLRRGAFAARNVAAGERIKSSDVFFAFPVQDNQVTANDWSKYNSYSALSAIKEGEPIRTGNSRCVGTREAVNSIVHKVRAFLAEARIALPGEADFEISHHFGLDRFDEFGITMITLVNREYCKKLIVMLPGQKHPEQYHERKEETFHVLYGDMRLIIDGQERLCRPGSVVTIERGARHAFESIDGTIIEEISSTHYPDDSFYTDPEIGKNRDRKTSVTHWLE